MILNTSIIIFLMLTIPVNLVYAGTLADFENDATKNRESNPSSNSKNSNECGFLDILFGCSTTPKTTRKSEPRTKQKRKSHPSLLYSRYNGRPYFRADAHYQKANSDISALDLEIEMSNSRFGLHGKMNEFKETNPNDKLNFSQVHGLLTLYKNDFFHLDFGVGFGLLTGDQSTKGFSIFAPARINLNRNFGVEMYSSITELNENAIFDTRISLLKRFKNMSIVASYFALAAPSETLQGPALGLSFTFK